MIEVWKYPLEVVEEQGFELPEVTVPVHVGIQREEIFLWALVDTDKEIHTDIWRYFSVYPTGEPVPPSSKYIGTVFLGEEVYHVFEDE